LNGCADVYNLDEKAFTIKKIAPIQNSKINKGMLKI